MTQSQTPRCRCEFQLSSTLLSHLVRASGFSASAVCKSTLTCGRTWDTKEKEKWKGQDKKRETRERIGRRRRRVRKARTKSQRRSFFEDSFFLLTIIWTIIWKGGKNVRDQISQKFLAFGFLRYVYNIFKNFFRLTWKFVCSSSSTASSWPSWGWERFSFHQLSMLG